MTFDDGIVKIYSITNTAAAGAKPKETLGDHQDHCFSFWTVGIQRYYEALKADQRITDVINIPDWHDIRTDTMIAVMEDDSQHRIRQVQKTYDEDRLKITRLSLERKGSVYAVMPASSSQQPSDGDAGSASLSGDGQTG